MAFLKFCWASSRDARTRACVFGLTLCFTPWFVACGSSEHSQVDAEAHDGAADLDGGTGSTVALFNFDTGQVPYPSDLSRDAERRQLALDTDDPGLSDAERFIAKRLNQVDGWSTTSTASVEFSAAVDPASAVLGQSVYVVRWHAPGEDTTGETLLPGTGVKGVSLDFDRADTRMRLLAPAEGWERGATYLAFVLGGEDGVRDAEGRQVASDTSFEMLRSNQALAPGALEEARLQLAPLFDAASTVVANRESIVSLWSFTVTERVEVAMDLARQRTPLPFEPLRDPRTGLVNLPTLASDTAFEHAAKEALRTYDGFSISSEILIPLTGAVDPDSVDAKSVRFFRLGEKAEQLDATLEVFGDNQFVAVRPSVLPLAQGTDYAVVLGNEVVDADAKSAIAMPVGHALLSPAPLLTDEGHSMVAALDDRTAASLEPARKALAPLLVGENTENWAAAWSFRTLRAEDKLDAYARAAKEGGIEPQVTVLERQSAVEASVDFALGAASVANVEEVVTGTIRSPYYLDPRSHAFRADKSFELNDVTFAMALPREPLDPMPVVVFGHGIMTERRFVLAVANSLASRGMAAIAIDLPFHGTRTVCIDSSPIALVNPQTGEPTNFPPCADGARCDAATGGCVDESSGEPAAFFQWPVLGYPTASGAAFLDLENLPAIPSHFAQAYVDLGALVHALEQGDWSDVTDITIDRTKFYWVGQSLGGIIGATFVATTPKMKRAVFNVAGAGLVDVFEQSTFFEAQVDGYFRRHGLVRDSYDGRRFFSVARWLVDGVDPQSIAHRYRTSGQEALIQMAVGDVIVPNVSTETLIRVSGLPKRDYLGTHAFLTAPEAATLRGLRDMGEFLSTD